MKEKKNTLIIKLASFVCVGVVFIALIMNATICSDDSRIEYCFLDNRFNDFLEPLFPVVLSILVSSFFALSISFKAFKKWLKFAAAWLVFEIIWIINVPVTSHYDFDFGPVTKELAAVWFGSLFVIISLIMFVVLTIKEKRKK